MVSVTQQMLQASLDDQLVFGWNILETAYSIYLVSKSCCVLININTFWSTQTFK